MKKKKSFQFLCTSSAFRLVVSFLYPMATSSGWRSLRVALLYSVAWIDELCLIQCRLCNNRGLKLSLHIRCFLSSEGLSHARVNGFEFDKFYKSFFGHSWYGLKLSYIIQLYKKVSQKKAWIFFQASLQLLKLLIDFNFHWKCAWK